MQKINIDIGPDGNTSVEAEGYKGGDCTAATKFIEKALGRILKRRRKQEYWQTDTRTRNRNKADIRNGG